VFDNKRALRCSRKTPAQLVIKLRAAGISSLDAVYLVLRSSKGSQKPKRPFECWETIITGKHERRLILDLGNIVIVQSLLLSFDDYVCGGRRSERIKGANYPSINGT
jgi:hypothetical protein